MKPASSPILAINGGSSSVKCALFKAGEDATPLVGREN